MQKDKAIIAYGTAIALLGLGGIFISGRNWSPPSVTPDISTDNNTEPVAPVEPVAGGNCKDMENYFNINFGRSDTRVSNFEGIIQVDLIGDMFCDGGAIIQTLPTGRKTCSGWIYYTRRDHRLGWRARSAADCFVSQ